MGKEWHCKDLTPVGFQMKTPAYEKCRGPVMCNFISKWILFEPVQVFLRKLVLWVKLDCFLKRLSRLLFVPGSLITDS